jgi:sphingomyelin phosphodiesterase
VFPALGNHEPHPTNLYYLLNPDVQELMSLIPGWWQPLADMGEEQLETINKAAYYTMSSPVPGLRIVTINTNFWYALNFYNILNDGSPELLEMTQWIESTLQKSRDSNEKVIMVLHHPISGEDVIVTHSRWYSKLVSEYSDVIVLQMAGHTHNDEFRVFTDPIEQTTKGVFLVAPSITPFSSQGSINPSMRVYHLDPETYELVDYEQYRMYFGYNPKDAPEIKLIYRATEEFSLPDMSADSFLAFANRMKEDDELFQKWYSHRNTDAPRNNMCTGECQMRQLCQLSTSSFDDVVLCYRQINVTESGKNNVNTVNKDFIVPKTGVDSIKKQNVDLTRD